MTAARAKRYAALGVAAIVLPLTFATGAAVREAVENLHADPFTIAERAAEEVGR